jgi:hypothetical protein
MRSIAAVFAAMALGVPCAALLEDRVDERGRELLAGDLVDQLRDVVGPRQRGLHGDGVERAVGVGATARHQGSRREVRLPVLA